MRTSTVTCDGCGFDLTYTHNSVDYRLRLASEAKPIYPDAGVVADMFISSSIDCDKHFCRLDCMERWLTEGAK